MAATVIPAKAKAVNGRVPYLSLDIQSAAVLAFNGARVAWRLPAGFKAKPSVQFGAARVYPIPTHGPHVGMDEVSNKPGVLCVMASDGGCAFADIVVP